jgi:acetyl esterase
MRVDVRYGDGPAALADVHLPPPSAPDPPLLVNLHGGGWYTGDKALATRCCDALADRGLVVVNANYRIRPYDPVPAMVDDALTVLRWVASSEAPDAVHEASRRGIALAGDSAGAHVAVLSALAGASTVDAVVCWCGGLALGALQVGVDDPLAERFAVYVRALTGSEPGSAAATERLAQLDPVRRLHDGMPPTLVATSALDFFRTSSLQYVRAAQAAGLPVELLDYDASHTACTHSWQLDPLLRESQDTYDLTAAFLRAAFTARKATSRPSGCCSSPSWT